MSFSLKNNIYIEYKKSPLTQSIQKKRITKLKKIFLPVDVYALATRALIVACADAVIINKQKKLIYLAKRNVLPMKNYWTIGGRRYPGESGFESVKRNFERETQLKISTKRFKFITQQEFIWKNRKEYPSNKGKHDIISFYAIELTPQELEFVNLELCKNEYIQASLKPFTYDQLGKIHPFLKKLHQIIFNDL